MRVTNLISRPRRVLFLLGIAMVLAILLTQLAKGSATVETESPGPIVLSNTAKSTLVGLGLQPTTAVKSRSNGRSVQSTNTSKNRSVGPSARTTGTVKSTSIRPDIRSTDTARSSTPGPVARSTTAAKSSTVEASARTSVKSTSSIRPDIRSTDTAKSSTAGPDARSTTTAKSRPVTVVTKPIGDSVRTTTVKTVERKPVGSKVQSITTAKNIPVGNGVKSTTLPDIKKNDLQPKPQGPKILILSLMHNSEKIIPTFKKLVKKLTYPHSLISIGIGEDSSIDNTIELAISMVNEFKSEFRRAEFHHFSELSESHKTWHIDNAPQAKHGMEIQFVRRRHIALARNMLAFRALSDEDYVMWLDSDVDETPPNIVESLLAAKKDIVVPICMIGPRTKPNLYDWNTWKETSESLKYIKDTRPEYLFLESYGQKRPGRLQADRFLSEDLVEVDGVGGCLILLKAIHVRQGLSFPSFIFRNQIETEGFSRMAQAMGLKLWLMPRLRIFHACNSESWGNDCK